MDKMTLKELNPCGVTMNDNSENLLYREDITGPQGARYTLFVELHHTTIDVVKAKRWLRDNLDVVQIYTVKEKI